jgi:hypothetical protein
MSLDFSLERVQPTEVFTANITHNVNEMWAKAGVYDALYNSGDKLASELIPFIKKGIAYFMDHREELELLNPKNGGGSYGSAFRFLNEVLAACKEFPDAIIRISK